MKYKLLKPLPGMEIGRIIAEEDIEVFGGKGIKFADKYPDFFDPIVERKTYDDLDVGDTVWYIHTGGYVESSKYRPVHCRSEIFITSEEAEDEHKRREYLTRECTITHGDMVYYWNKQENCVSSFRYSEDSSIHIILRNSRMLFDSSEECITSMKDLDLVRLFLTER